MEYALRQLKKLSVYNNQAFTLIELLVTISLMGILLLLAIPNMSGIFESSQTSQQSHDFISAIQFSVQEAGKQNGNISVCAKKPSVDQCVAYTTTPATDAWRNGWMVFVDSNNNGIFDGSDVLLKTQFNNTNKILITAPSSTVTIAADGVVTRGQGTYYFSPTKCTASTGHRIILYKSGQLSIKGGICP